jgi:hypothetical protein
MGLVKKATKAGGGGSFGTPPSEDNHKAAVVAVVELGTHHEVYQGAGSNKHKVLICYEILDEQDDRGGNLLMAESYTFSLYENANFRKVVAACGFKVGEGDEFDAAKLLGQPLRITVEHSAKGEAVYANIAALAPADRADRPKPGERVKTQQVPFAWSLDDGEYRECDWIPWTYCRVTGKRRPAGEIIADCQERKKAPPRRHVPDDGDDPDNPFTGANAGGRKPGTDDSDPF